MRYLSWSFILFYLAFTNSTKGNFLVIHLLIIQRLQGKSHQNYYFQYFLIELSKMKYWKWMLICQILLVLSQLVYYWNLNLKICLYSVKIFKFPIISAILMYHSNHVSSKEVHFHWHHHSLKDLKVKYFLDEFLYHHQEIQVPYKVTRVLYPNELIVPSFAILLLIWILNKYERRSEKSIYRRGKTDICQINYS